MTRRRQGLSSAEVRRRSGATYRQLDYWAQEGYLRPSVRPAGGSGTIRLYSQDDVVIAITLVAVSRVLRDWNMYALVAAALQSGERRFTIGGPLASLSVDVDAIGSKGGAS
jgi:hypothetical protein